MANTTALRGLCPAPFFQDTSFGGGGYVTGRLCEQVAPGLNCCLPCPLTDWAYADNFRTLTTVPDWFSVVGLSCCAFLLSSWAVLPVEKTHRHYLSICLTLSVIMLNLGFVVPLAANPEQCYDEITPNGMASSSVCAASGALLLGGGLSGVIWVFVRSLSLHLQICWQMVVGRYYMWTALVVGWGLSILGTALALVYSGVSFRFGTTCHINHNNSLADFWIPLLVLAGLALLIQFATFGYCIKVYLASLSDNSASTENSGLPSYTNSIVTMTPRQAYRRVRRVVQLQWRGIVIVLIIITDVIFFSIVFVFQDNTEEAVKTDASRAASWITCLVATAGDKDKCLAYTSSFVMSLPTIIAVLIMLSLNGMWLLVLLGRWSMVEGWAELVSTCCGARRKEFVSVDARIDNKESRSYEMLSRDSGKAEDVLTPISATKSPAKTAASPPASGRLTPDYFGQTARYQPHQRSFSSPKPPPVGEFKKVDFDTGNIYARQPAAGFEDMNPLGMNRI